MRLNLALLCSLLFMPVESPAQPLPPQITRIDIVQYGIFTFDRLEKDPTAPSPRFVGSEPWLKESTRVIPLQEGVSFGLLFNVAGEPAGVQVPLHMITISPPSRSGTALPPELAHRSETDIKVWPGELNWTGKKANPQLKSGVMTIQLWSGNRKLAEESFTLVEPANAEKK